ncbi:MAG TPA: tetratricopeptide repeat protein [Leptospiraceae bacterium]|nr:tetratricopeptide repeat protein [Leptospiraceae bacterium]HMZ59164.1 tetratricopeptide repeat protein [Leptospiraceae bacterium]HNF12999.1 tetratricopeptide repeat protein [Leptospiraceae bacterium]HNF22988.1 tetratricopeptide repeat protein [Leptospiraceae bacterium]HNH08101.1 tetratricopeptide repeat protein [Leptospiraceae bacterium]
MFLNRDDLSSVLLKFQIRYFFIILLFAVPIFSENRDGRPVKSAAELIREGDSFYREKNYRRALGSYKAALEVNSGSNSALLGYAKSSLQVGSVEDARTAFKIVVDKDHSNNDALAGYADALSRSDKHADALKVLEKRMETDPYNPGLLMIRAEILLRMGKNDLALKRLEDAKGKIQRNYDFDLLLAKAYIANKRFQPASEIIHNLTRQQPENPENFTEKARLNLELAAREENGEKVSALVREALGLLETSVSLDKTGAAPKRLLIRTHLWLGNRSEALRITEELLEDYPSDSELLYFHSYLSTELGHQDKAVQSFSTLMKTDDLNSIARFSAEEFAKSHLQERHSLRVKLGRYHYEEYLRISREFLYDTARFHISRAKELIPENKFLKSALLDYYYKFGYRSNLIRMLLKLRQDDPDDIKINNRLEAVLKSMRESLSYLEGFLDKEGELITGARNPVEIFLFDLKPLKFLPDYPDAGNLLNIAIRHSLQLKSSVKPVSGKDEEVIRNALASSREKAKYTGGIYYYPEILEKLNIGRKKESYIRYIGYGEYETDHNVMKINYHIYDRQSGKVINTSRIISKGRNMMAEVSSRIAVNTASAIQPEGRIVKVKPDSFIINLGFRDGIKKGSKIRIFENDREIGTAPVENLDEYISEIRPKNSSWRENVGLGFRVRPALPEKK